LKHGERTLRSQIVFSREWGSAEERLRLVRRRRSGAAADAPNSQRPTRLLGNPPACCCFPPALHAAASDAAATAQADRLARVAGTERLAALLCRKDCAALRKGDLITLARAWGYKSSIWCASAR
jgi:hypothetical protein